jgi:membrane protein YdbS with pleckstrin-like domain
MAVSKAVSMEEAFAPPGVAWVRPSRRLLAQRRLVLSVWCAVLGLLSAVPLLLRGHGWLVALTLAVGLVALAWGWVLLARNFRSWGYAQRADDLLVRHGVIVKHLTVVPYGRMQFVDVSAGPLDRLFSIANVQLHTASAATDAAIPGLPPQAAAELRDRLAALGEARSAGL